MRHLRLLVNIKGKHRKEMLEGRPHLVVPAVMLKGDTVLDGEAAGPVFYPADENIKSVPRWNHMPIVVNHAKKGSKFVSARTTEYLNARKVGILLNTASDETGKLSTECWFDEERVKQVDQRVYKAIVNNEAMETSTGLGAKLRKKQGSANGKKYNRAAYEYAPDHFAILPDDKGALSVADGGGLFANIARGEPESTLTVLNRSMLEAVKKVGVEVIANEASFSEVSRQISDLLSAKYGKPGKYWTGYLCDVYPDYAIFRTSYDSPGDSRNLYMIGYKMDAGGDIVSLVGDAQEVIQSTEYKLKSGGKKYIVNQAGDKLTESDEEQPAPVPDPVPILNEETPMPFDKKVHLDTLIANGQLDAAKRAEFEKLPDSVLEAMKVAPKETTTVVNKEATSPATVVTSQSWDEIMKNAPPEVVQVINQGQKALTRSKEAYIKTILANKGNKFKEEALNKITDIDLLANMAEIARSATLANSAEGDNESPFVPGYKPDYTGMGTPDPELAAALAEEEAQPVVNKKGGKPDKNMPPELLANKAGLPVPRSDYGKPKKLKVAKTEDDEDEEAA